MHPNHRQKSLSSGLMFEGIVPSNFGQKNVVSFYRMFPRILYSLLAQFHAWHCANSSANSVKFSSRLFVCRCHWRLSKRSFLNNVEAEAVFFTNFDEMFSGWRIPQLAICARGSCAFLRMDRTGFSGKRVNKNPEIRIPTFQHCAPSRWKLCWMSVLFPICCSACYCCLYAGTNTSRLNCSLLWLRA